VDIFTQVQLAIGIRSLERSKYAIGIFGSFNRENKIYLISLKEFLNSHGYKARISEDYEMSYPLKKNETKYQYSRRMSEMLIEHSDVYIIFLFYENEKDHNINQSACMEIEILNQRNKPCVLVFHEEHCYEQCKSVIKGLIGGSFYHPRPVNNWRWDIFTRYDHFNKSIYEEPDIEITAMMTCFDFIKNI